MSGLLAGWNQRRVRVESFRQHPGVGLQEQRFGLFTGDAVCRESTREARRGLRMVNGSRSMERNPPNLAFTSFARMGASSTAGRRRPSAVVPRRKLDLTTLVTGRRSCIALPITGGDPEAVRGTANEWSRKNHRIVSGFTIPGTLVVRGRTCEGRLRAAAKRPTCFRSNSQDGTSRLPRPASVPDAQPRPAGRQPAVVLRLCLQDHANRLSHRTSRGAEA